jgi:hypothetical protein
MLWDVTHIRIVEVLSYDLGNVNWTRNLEIRILGETERRCNKTSNYKIDLIGPKEVRRMKIGIATANNYVLLQWDMYLRILYK